MILNGANYDKAGLDESRALLNNNDTIVAIATGSGLSGIGIVRLSGADAISIADKMFKGNTALTDAAEYTLNYGYVYDDNEKIDEVIVGIYRAPHSYTTEDVVEINCHGGRFVLKCVLELAIKNGARAAGPGEFTKRAFLGGRIDLSQAESVMDLISSESEFARKSAMQHLSGALSERIRSLRERLLRETAHIEAALDDPEHISLDGFGEKLRFVLNEISTEIDKLLKTADEGILLKEGIPVVLLGRPNVGKSSVWNRLLGEDRAIVTDIAGTTRDVLEESVRINDITLRLSDTAGIRDTNDKVESIGVERTRRTADSARLIICVLDGASPLTLEDISLIKEHRGRPMIIILNKSDLAPAFDIKDLAPYTDASIIRVSAVLGDGFSLLKDSISNCFSDAYVEEDVIITSLRQKTALTAAKKSLELAIGGINSGVSEEFLTVDLMDAYGFLGSIIGEMPEEDLIDKIFSEFCMGK